MLKQSLGKLKLFVTLLKVASELQTARVRFPYRLAVHFVERVFIRREIQSTLLKAA